ncbi:hypothetical protein FQN51_005311 [Onygenales sp. PD_10]|nr:hypothetical protein FQN51_005311 [Onygenales sp. PD_10]
MADSLRQAAVKPSPLRDINSPTKLKTLAQYFFDRPKDERPLGLLSVDIVLVYTYQTEEQNLFIFEEKPKPGQRVQADGEKRTGRLSTEDVRSLRSHAESTSVNSPLRLHRIPEGASLPSHVDSKAGRTSIGTRDIGTTRKESHEGDTRRLEVPPSRERSKSPSGGKQPIRRVHWIRDKTMLGGQVPESRVLGLGYQVSEGNWGIDFSSAATDLKGFLSHRDKLRGRALVLIGHAYGSFIIQRALEDPEIRSWGLYSTMAGVIFLGIPSDKSNSSPEKKRFQPLGPAMVKDSIQMTARRQPFPIFCFNGKDNQHVPHNNNPVSSPEVPSLDRVIKQGKNSCGYIWPLPDDFSTGIRFPGPKNSTFKLLTDCIVHFAESWHFFNAVQEDNLSKVEFLLDRGVHIERKDQTGQTALHKAVQHKRLKTIRNLIMHGANVDTRDRDGKTPLRFAVENPDAEIVEFLLQQNANIDSGDREAVGSLPEESDDVRALLSRPPLRDGGGGGGSFTDMRSSPIKRRLQATPSAELFDLTISEVFAFTKPDDPTAKLWKFFPVGHPISDTIYGEGDLETLASDKRDQSVNGNLFCRWYHIPANNMLWVQDLFEKLGFSHEPQWSGYRQDNDIPHSRSIIPHAAKHRMKKSDNTDYVTYSLFMPYVSYEKQSRQLQFSSFIKEVHEETKGSLSTRHQGFSGANREGPLDSPDDTSVTGTPSEVSATQQYSWKVLDAPSEDGSDAMPSRKNSSTTFFDLSHQLLIKEFLHKYKPLHLRRTLDQYHYYMLSDTVTRDQDQVVTRWFRETKKRDEGTTKNKDKFRKRELIRWFQRFKREHAEVKRGGATDWVRALWRKLWLGPTHWIGQNAYQEKESDDEPELPPDLEIEDLDYVSEVAEHNMLMVDQLWLWIIIGGPGKPDTVISCFPNRQGEDSEDADDLRTQVLNRPKGSTAITTTGELVSRIIATCSGAFHRSQKAEMLQFAQYFESSIGRVGHKETTLFKEFQNSQETVDRLNEISTLCKIDLKKEKTMVFDNMQSIATETALLAEVKDILDEIGIIMSVLYVQKSIIAEPMLQELSDTSPGHEASKTINVAIEDFTAMRERAREVLKSVNNLLDLKQKQANVSEARSARERAQETARQGIVILMFTVITIIFAPLSFITSFLSLGVTQFPKDKTSGETSWPLSLVCAFIFGISFAFSLPLMALAFQVESISTLWHERLKGRLAVNLPPQPPPLEKRRFDDSMSFHPDSLMSTGETLLGNGGNSDFYSHDSFKENASSGRRGNLFGSEWNPTWRRRRNHPDSRFGDEENGDFDGPQARG